MPGGHFLQPMLAASSPPRLVNATRDVVLATRTEGAFDSKSRRRGLLGRAGLAPSEALVIAPSNAIHTFGMRFPIDVLFVDRSGKVLKRVVALGRRRIALSLRAFAVVEFTARHDGVSRTRVGDVLVVSRQ